VGQGPLRGIRVVELAGIGPGPFACMLLADLGADVIRVARRGAQVLPGNALNRGRPALAADLKNPRDLQRVRTLADRADVLIEGYRPGVTERLGLGPDELTTRNPRLVYARMTGWGQQGPLAQRAGHDINYLGLTGALHAIGEAGGKPIPPLNLVADFGGGALYCVVGILSALLERAGSGRGQVVDVAMVDGAASLMAMTYGMFSEGVWADERGANALDGGAPFYGTYACSDGKYVAVGSLEPQFYAALGATLGVELPDQQDRSTWPALRKTLTETFAQHPRDHWAEVFAGVDACVTPVMSLTEAATGVHLAARGTLVQTGERTEPAAAPRFSRTPGRHGAPPDEPDELPAEVLSDWGIDPGQWPTT